MAGRLGRLALVGLAALGLAMGALAADGPGVLGSNAAMAGSSKNGCEPGDP